MLAESEEEEEAAGQPAPAQSVAKRLLQKVRDLPKPRKYGAVSAGAGGEPSSSWNWDCSGLLRRAPLPGSSRESDEEPLLFALTWAQPARHGTVPSPRNGHTMVLIGMHL